MFSQNGFQSTMHYIKYAASVSRVVLFASGADQKKIARGRNLTFSNQKTSNFASGNGENILRLLLLSRVGKQANASQKFSYF